MGKGNEVKETEQEKELQRVSIDKWNDHQRRLVPLENKVIESANVATNAGRMRAGGAVNAEIAQAGTAALPGSPNSGRSLSAVPALDVAKTAAKAQVAAAQSVEDQRASALGNVVLVGEGKSARATEGFEVAANNAVSSAITGAQTKQATRQAIGSAIGTVAGAGLYAYQKGAISGAAGKLSDFGTAGGQAAAISGANPSDPNGYSYNPSNGQFYWNKR